MDNQLQINNSRESLEDAKLVDKNLVGMFQYFGMQKTNIDGISYYLLNTKCKNALWNMICLPDAADILTINNMESTFKLQNVPFSWWIDKNKVSDNMISHFENSGYICFGDVPGMIIDLTNYQDKPTNINRDIHIKPITSIKDFVDWTKVLAKCFEFSDDVCDLYVDKLSSFLGKNNVFIPLAAYNGTKIVSTASIVFVDGVAGFYNDATLPEYRSRGIATTLYQVRAKMLKDLGIQKAVIQTSPMATTIAKRFGFTVVTNYKIYSMVT